MKLKIAEIFGQRQAPWIDVFLGYNPPTARDSAGHLFTIGWYGCLITSFGIYINKNPKDVNDLLKANQGFSPNSGNFVWGKSTVLGLTETYRSPYYSDAVTAQGLAKMRELLDAGKPLITHVDFDPRDPDDDQHWILVYGYDANDVFYAVDPWSGSLITLDVYGGVKRAVLEWRAYDKVLPKDEALNYEKLYNECRVERDANHNDRMALYEELGFNGTFNRLVAVEEIKKLKSIEKQSGEKDTQLAELRKQLAEVREELRIANEKLVEIEKKANETKETTETVKTNVESTTVKANDIAEKIDKIATDAPIKTGWQLIFEGINRLLGRG